MTEAMKDSKTRWLGQIPANWDMVRVKDCFDRKNKKANQKDPIVLSLARSGVKIRDISSNEGQLAADYTNYNPVAKDDILINPMDLVSGDNCNISRVEGVISPAYVNLRYKKGINPRFYNYYFKLQYWLGAFFAHGFGVSFDNRWTLSYETLSKYPLVLPPSDEQDKIADFLDEKCAEIDQLSEDIQKQIDILEEYKKSVITRAVTKGLNPNAEMKDSGVQWIGMMPKNWKLPKILYCLEMPITDGPHTTPELFDDGVPFVSAEAVSTGDGKINFDNIRGFISEKFYKECCKKYIPKKDDIYMIKSGATTGKIAIVDTDKKFTIWSPLAVFRVNRDIVIPKYMYYSLYSDYIQRQVETGWTYGTQQNIGMRSLEKMKLCVPSIDEQNNIVEFLDKVYDEANNTIEAYRDQLQKLKTYEKSIIYEYVTGKKRVKGAL